MFKLEHGKSYIWLFPICVKLGIVLGLLLYIFSGESSPAASLALPITMGMLTGLQWHSGVALDSWWRARHPRGGKHFWGMLIFQGFAVVAMVIAILVSAISIR